MPRAYPVEQPHDEKAHGEADERRADEGQEDFEDQPLEVYGPGSGMGPAGADEPADEGVGRGRGYAQPPGEEVPEDGPHEGGQHENVAALDDVRVDQAAAQGLGDFRAQQRAHEVQGGRHGDGVLGLCHLGGDDARDGKILFSYFLM